MKLHTTLLLLTISLSNFYSTIDAKSNQDKDQYSVGHSRQTLLNADWLYLEDPVENFDGLSSTKKSWLKINLPHTWNTFDAVDAIPGYRRSASWYRKEIQIPIFEDNHRFILYFEGVNITSEVFVNGEKAGGHVGGYVGFEIDITPYVRPGETNNIFVRASNAFNPDIIPSQKSDFHIYGGITRDVWLKVVPIVHLSKVKIRTPKVSRSIAEVELEIKLLNADVKENSYEIDVAIFGRKGKEVGRKTLKHFIPLGESFFRIQMPNIKNPFLWSPHDPSLYSVRLQLKQSGRVVDEISDRFGCRWYEFKEHGPFYLNGERLLLRGTHRHEDYAGYANAMPDSLHRKDIKMIKEMGANFVRLAHYPQDPEIYRSCDELGLLVWDELPWCRGGMGSEEWKTNTRRLLKEQIEQNFNHPSIIIWSLGNEMYWLPDFENGDNTDSLRAMVKELNDIAHTLDPSRLTATRKFTEGADLVDLVSPSMWPGWYSGVYKGFEKAITDAQKKFKRSFHAEYGGDSHVGRHTENPVSGDGTAFGDGWEENIKPQKVKNVSQSGDWGESYIVDLFDWYLHISEQTEWLTGNAQWAFKDFPTPLRPENPIPYVNQKGLVDRSGKPKDAYYVFKSYWTTSPSFVYIESHTWTERSGPANLKREVNVFSNCTEAELFHDGVSHGKLKRDIKSYPASGLSWLVNFAEGDNKLIVIGFKDGKRASMDSISVRYSYQKSEITDRIELSSEKLPNDNLLITALAVDFNGNRCSEYNKRIYFTSEGPGKLFENYGTPTRSSIIEMANGKAQIELKPSTLGATIIEARNQDFKGAYITIP